jgi:hypothetical protein
VITTIYFLFVVLSCLLGLANWRRGIYLAILVDILRDPVRKLDESQTVLITLSVGAIWGAVFFGMLQQYQPVIRDFLSRNISFYKSIQLVAFALIPGVLLSLLLYQSGYRLVILGVISYSAPFLGVFIGLAFSQNPAEINKLLRFYTIVNSIALLGVALEYANVDVPALGGLKNMEWIRFSGHDTIKLIAGFYRSPDIMGLHAAHVVMFAIYLSAIDTKNRLLWIPLVVWAAVCLILGGRRKMIGMPLVFIASFLILASYVKSFRFSNFLAPASLVGTCAMLLFLVTSDNSVSQEYLDYASTLFTEGLQRSNQLVSGSVWTTLQQSGFFGSGIGSATQGNYQTVGATGGWQEDGISRLFRELGVPGVLLILFAGINLLKSISWSIKRISPTDPQCIMQLSLLSMVIANMASFAISHQQYSGDPSSALLVLLLLGMALGLGFFADLKPNPFLARQSIAMRASRRFMTP